MRNKRNQILLLIPFLVFALTRCNKEKVNPEYESYNHKTFIGYSNRDIVSSENYDYLIVEIQYFKDHAPATGSLNNLKTFIESIVQKPGGVAIKLKEITSQSKTSYSVDDIRNIEDDNRAFYTHRDTMSVYFLFVNAPYSENDGSTTLGIAYLNTSMAIFENDIKELSGGFGQPGRELLETTVLNHEFGHILGLVNNNLTMVNEHQDEENGKHCDNENCLMYWAVETGSFVSNLVGQSEAPSLDINCLNDLSTIQ